MKRPKLKKASKRVSCAKRFKIQKKVREHNRKLRKVAKKKGISRKPKKDIGVPNSAPFKEEVLREAEQRKQELITGHHSGPARLMTQNLIFNKIKYRGKNNNNKKIGISKIGRYCHLKMFILQQQRKQRGINAVLDHSRAASCFGRDCLLQTLTDLANKKDAETMLKVGVVGFPNVGKSSIINSLKEVRVCHVGVQRGMTRCKQEVHITKRLKMIDSPGIVAASSNPGDVMALRSLQVEEKEESPLEAVRTLLKQCNQQHIMLLYNVPDYRNSLEFLTTFAKKRGFLQKGGVPNTELAAMTFLSDWTGPKLSYHSRAPEHQGLPSYLTDAIVTELRSGLDMDVVRKGNENVKKGVRFPNLASSISFNARGPTAGVLNVSELPKETITITAPTEADEKMDGTVNTEEPEAETQVSTVVTQIQESTKKRKAKPTKKVKYVPVNIDLTSVQHNNDDAYDFNTDFV
ncbi:guanine nucleotide-binding protein-like 3 [Sinocyclocheilus grahami]|uniref:guanine nucleotide-binding protein-like 3 n=1 Tax=Sinocyclocheilus grahami TaxID=75366 RepID=UPI0007ACF606|nr:PREDICTED: guanine nucleotide-binding protein-like 3 [Sinocyclocheilus grahami]